MRYIPTIQLLHMAHAKNETDAVPDRPIELEDRPLTKLPTEVLLCIAEFLTDMDIVSLSLSCRNLNFRLDNFKDRMLDNRLRVVNEDLKTELLVRLARDLPELFCCFDCAKIRSVSEVLAPSLTTIGAPLTALKCMTHPD